MSPKTQVPVNNPAQLSRASSVQPQVDTQLMLLVRNGDPAAFKKLFNKFKGPIMSYALSLVQNPRIAEEITQEVFLKVFRVRETYEPSAEFSTWLWTLARNASLDHLRKKSEILFAPAPEDCESESAGGIRLEDIESPLKDAECLLLEQAEAARLTHCMGELTLIQSEALALRTVSELSYDEIALLMKISLSAVKSLIFRSKNALIACLEGSQHDQ